MAEARGPQARAQGRHIDTSFGKDAIGVVGLALLITWSFLFWNGPLLDYTLQAGSGMNSLFLGQGVACALTALAFAVTSPRVARSPGWHVAFGFAAACASLACALDWVAVLSASEGLALAAFCLSGTGSALFLCWQEYLSARGVAATAARLVVAYVLAAITFLAVSTCPATCIELVSTALPLASFACAVASRVETMTSHEEAARLRPAGHIKRSLSAVPWRLPVIVAVAHFCYGITRVGGIVVDGTESFDVPSVLGSAVPIACCLLGAALAYLAYRANAIAGLYIAFPMLALGCVLEPGASSWGSVATFGMVNVGSELIRFLTWFLMIDVIVKDGASALLCVAILRVAHWGGCTLGQAVSLAVGDGSTVASVAIVILMAGLIAILGANTLFARQSRDGRLTVSMGPGAKEAEAQEPCAASSFQGVTAQGAQGARTGDGEDRSAADGRATGSACASGSRPTSPRSAAGEALQRRVERTARECGLSPRETEVLAIWVTGRTASYIEKVLFISRSTVKTHLNHIYTKTCTSNREELIELVNSHRAVR